MRFVNTHHEAIGQFTLQIQIAIKNIQRVIIGSNDLIIEDADTPNAAYISTRIGIMVQGWLNRYIGYFPYDGLAFPIQLEQAAAFTHRRGPGYSSKVNIHTACLLIHLNKVR